jgi:hypothetical protein
MCDATFIEEVLLIYFSTLSKSENIIKVCSDSIFSTATSVSSIVRASIDSVDSIFAILYCQLVPLLTFIDVNPMLQFVLHFESCL